MKKIVLLLLLIPLSPLFSHGAEYTILSDRIIKIETRFDTGEYFSRAEVLVFFPGEDTPAYKLQTDEKGCFYLQPDREGTWVLQVRGEGGHGLRINLPVDQTMLTVGKSGNHLNMVQKILMLLSVAWGTVGTVLFFRKRY